MSEIKHDIHIDATCSTIYRALTTAGGLESWFTSSVKGTGEVGTDWEMRFTDQPFFRWHITVSDDAKKVSWQCVEGPGNAPGTEVDFLLKATGDSSSTLTIVHRGWTQGDPKFERCVEIWRTLMAHLQQYCEKQLVEPAYQ